MEESAVLSAPAAKRRLPNANSSQRTAEAELRAGFRAEALTRTSDQEARLFASFFVLFSFKQRKKDIVPLFQRSLSINLYVSHLNFHV